MEEKSQGGQQSSIGSWSWLKKCSILTKNASVATYDHADQIIDYTYTIANNGNVTLSGPFNVTDNKFSITQPSETILAPLDEIIIHVFYPIKQSDMEMGFITNQASVSGYFDLVTHL